VLVTGLPLTEIAGFALGREIFASKHLQVALSHPGVPRAIVFPPWGASLIEITGVGLGGIIRHTAGATTALTLIIVGDVTLGQLLPAGLRQYQPCDDALVAEARAGRRGTAH
jgi:ABC-2 type transport system permease protein